MYDGLAIDTRRQKLYYADAADNGGKVGELSTDGTAHRVLISVANSKPRSLVLDDDNRYSSSGCHVAYRIKIICVLTARRVKKNPLTFVDISAVRANF